jgi:hypothetical protein
MIKTRQKNLLHEAQAILAHGSSLEAEQKNIWWKSRTRMCTHVQSGDEIMRQLERMVFGDENTGKAKTGDKKKGKKQLLMM